MEVYIIVNKETLECLTYYKGEIGFSNKICSNLSLEKATDLYNSLFRKSNYYLLKVNWNDYRDLEELFKTYHNPNTPLDKKESITAKIKKYEVVTYINKLYGF